MSMLVPSSRRWWLSPGACDFWVTNKHTSAGVVVNYRGSRVCMTNSFRLRREEPSEGGGAPGPPPLFTYQARPGRPAAGSGASRPHPLVSRVQVLLWPKLLRGQGQWVNNLPHGKETVSEKCVSKTLTWWGPHTNVHVFLFTLFTRRHRYYSHKDRKRPEQRRSQAL